MSKKFVCTADPYAGFMMSFKNGLTVSVQWGKGNYCENRHHSDDVMRDEMGFVHSNTAEAAVWKTDDPKQEFIDANKFAPNGVESMDNVIGYLNPEDVIEFLKNVKDYKNATESKPYVIKDFDHYGYGYYAEIYFDERRIKIGNEQPREGGIYWSGSFDDFLQQSFRFEKDSLVLVEAVKNYLLKKRKNGG